MEKVIIDKIDVPVEVQEFDQGVCSLRVEVGTTGRKGGDSGHGCRTVLRLIDTGSTDMRGGIKGHYAGKSTVNAGGDNLERIEIAFGGDAELTNFFDALMFAMNTIAKQTDVMVSLDGFPDEWLADTLRNHGYQVIDPAFNAPEDNLSPKERKFVGYLYDLTKLYKETGSLKGMGLIREKYNISCITKDTFYRTGLNTLEDIEWLNTNEGKCFAQALYKDTCKKNFSNVKPYYTFTKGC